MGTTLGPHLRSLGGAAAVAVATIAGCKQPASRTSDAGGASASSGCGSQTFATVQLGEALAHLRAARLFATREQQRVALARLEPMLVAQIEAEPDSNFRGAAWLQVESPSVGTAAAAEVRAIEATEERYLGHGFDARVTQSSDTRRRAEYDQHMESVVKAVDPRSPKRCAEPQWQTMFAAALDAQAR